MAARIARTAAGAFCPVADSPLPVPVDARHRPRSIGFVSRNDSLGVRC